MNDKLKISVYNDSNRHNSVEIAVDTKCIVEFIKHSFLDKEKVLPESAVKILEIAKLSGNSEANSILQNLFPNLEMAVYPAISYSGIIDFLANKYHETRPIEHRYCMIGILFIRPGSNIHRQLNQELEYYHHRSGEYFDLFVAGYETEPWETNGNKTEFSSKLFNNIVTEFESVSQWKYSGGSELMLTNVKLLSRDTVSLDFSSSILINLDDLVDNKGFRDIGYFFEHLFEWSRYTKRKEVWSFSDHYIKERFPKEMLRLFMRWLPLSLEKDIREIASFAVKNIGKG